MSLEPSISAALPGTAVAPPLPPKQIDTRSRLMWALVAVVMIAFLVYCWIDVQASIGQFFTGVFGARGLVRSVLPQAIPPQWSQIWPGLKYAATTLAIAVLSIVFGVFWSVAMLPLAAKNIAPSRPVYEVVRIIQAVLRAIPELIMLILFNVVFGFTPFAATVALTFHGIGVKGKLFAEAVEEMDMSAVDALRIAGASRLQVFLHAVLPGVRGTLTGLTLYRLDANFRSAITLGAVGGGGIGFLIDNQMDLFNFPAVLSYLIIVVVAVLAIERLSTMLRARLA
jgi:phosphonate transport system permease protein